MSSTTQTSTDTESSTNSKTLPDIETEITDLCDEKRIHEKYYPTKKKSDPDDGRHKKCN